MSDIVTVGLHRSTLKAMCALDAHTFADGRATFHWRIRDALLSALIIELGRNEDEVTLRLELGVDNGAAITEEVLNDAGIQSDHMLRRALERGGFTR